MKTTIVDTFEPLTLIGGGKSTPAQLKAALALAPVCVAADGGARLALHAGVDLSAVIGDMDSILPEDKARIAPEQFHCIAEQDSTDFDKALRHLSAPLVIAVGFSGGKIDHELAALHTLVRRCNQRVVMLREEEIVFLCPPALTLPTTAGMRVSLFPMGPVRGRSSGLHWPIEGIDFAPNKRVGTSNRATGAVSLEVDAPYMLCILPKSFIQQVVSTLAALPEDALWPAHAE